jgi:hypothetical protein
VKKLAMMNNSTIPAADRATHVKIIAIALAASAAVLLTSVMARHPAANANAGIAVAGPAGKPVAVSLAI